MLPEFPKARQAIQKAWNKVLLEASRISDPLVSKVAVRAQREGNRAYWGETEIEYNRKSVSYEVPIESAKGVPTEKYFEIAENLGREIAEGQARSIFAALETPGPRNAAITTTEGPLTFELWLSKVEQMEIDFDNSNKPKWPSFYLSPNATLELKHALLNMSQEQKVKLEQLIEIKRREFNERASRRRLVD